MIIGQVLQSVVQATKTYYSPWIPTEGNLAVISCEVVDSEGLESFEITVQTKNSEDSDKDAVTPKDGSSVSITIATTETITKFNVGAKLSATGATDVGFKELFRYKYEVAGPTEGASGNGFVHFRMLNPGWLTNQLNS
jgi:hypothetical protein